MNYQCLTFSLSGPSSSLHFCSVNTPNLRNRAYKLPLTPGTPSYLGPATIPFLSCSATVKRFQRKPINARSLIINLHHRKSPVSLLTGDSYYCVTFKPYTTSISAGSLHRDNIASHPPARPPSLPSADDRDTVF